MKPKSGLILLFLVFILILSVSPALACEHIDSGEGQIVYNSYRAPTEDQDGTTGPGTCSVCGEAVAPAQVIPRISTQRKKAEDSKTPEPTKAPTPEPTAKPTATPVPAVTVSPVPEGPIIDPQSIADYLFAHGELPDNFLTKKEAQALGWDSRYNYVSDVAPGMSIGGDRFGNYEGLLPTAKGRQYYECDCYYTKGRRNAYRIIFSNDGLVFYTEDHYQTFTEMHPSVPGTTRAP